MLAVIARAFFGVLPHPLLTAARPMAGLQFQLGSLEEGTFQLKVGFLFCQ
jgi:hypothetical protein